MMSIKSSSIMDFMAYLPAMKISQQGLYELRATMLAHYQHQGAGCPQPLQPRLSRFGYEMFRGKAAVSGDQLGDSRFNSS